MAGDYDGSDYVGLDQNTWGDGTTDSTTQALSTYKENRLDSNARYLQCRGSQVTYQLYGSETPRKHTSVDKSALLYTWWPIDDNLKEITAYIRGTVVNNDSGTTGSVDIWLTLQDRSGNRTDFSNATTTATATGSEEIYSVTLDVTEENLESGDGFLGVWIQSNNEALPGSFTSVTGGGRDAFFDVQSLSAFDETNTLSENGGEKWPPLHRQPDSSTSEVLSAVYDTANFFGIDPSLGIVELSYIEPRSITIEERMEKSGKRGSYYAKDAATMRAQSTVLGQHTAKHGTNLDEIWSRPRCLAIGPVCEDGGTAGVGWTTGEFRKWRWLADTTSSTDFLMDEQMIQPRQGETKIVCYGWIAAFVQIDFGGEGLIPSGSNKSLKSYVENWSARGDLELRVKLEQLDDGDTDWSQATELANETKTMPDVAASLDAPINDSHLATQFYAARHPESLGSEESTFHFTFREGQIFEDDRNVMIPFVVEADTSSSTTQNDPMRATLELSQWATDPQYDGKYGENGNKVHVVCLQTAWFEEAPI